MKRKLIRILSPWRRRLLSLSVGMLLILDQLSNRSLPDAHWVGKGFQNFQLHPVAKWFLLWLVLLIGVFTSTDVHAGMLWIAGWGIVLSVYVIVLSVVTVIVGRKEFMKRVNPAR